MIKRQADPERDAISDIDAMPVHETGTSIAKKAATARTRHRALARRFRKNSQIATQSAEISSGIEEIAGFSDKIIESFDAAKQSLDRAARDSNEEKKLLHSLFESSGKTQEILASNTAAGERAAQELKGNFRCLEEVIDSIQKAAQVQGENLKTSQELGRLIETSDDLTSRLISLSDRADVAALNSALEAGKAGEYGAGFAVVADMLRKSAAAFQKRVENFTAILARIKTIQSGIASRAVEVSEKIRTVDVLIAGIRNAFDEMMISMDLLLSAAGENSIKNVMVFPAIDEDESSEEISLSLDSAMDSINHALSLIESQEGQFSDAASQADILLEITGKLASADVASSALDSLYTVIESFDKSMEAALELLETALPAIHNARQDIEILGKSSLSNREHLTRLSQSAEELLSVVRRSQETFVKLRESLAPSHTILLNVARELRILVSEDEAFLKDLYSLEPFRKDIVRFSESMADFSTRMDFFALNGGIEVTRAGVRGAGFALLPREFETIGSELTGLEQSIREYAYRLEEIARLLIKHEKSKPWQSILLSVTGIAESVQEILESHLANGAKENASLFSIITDTLRRIEKIREKSDAASKTASSAVQSITQAAEFAENQKNVFRQTIATAEKISILADELYPDEG
jgi:methyl-accepting chemotaxis protein